MKDDCIFCKLANGVMGERVLENTNAVLIEDKKPMAPYHVLVIPKEHWSDLTELQDKEGPLDIMAILGDMFDLVGTYVSSNNLKEWGYRTIINTGKDAGQTVPHFHLHVLGGAFLKNDFGA